VKAVCGVMPWTASCGAMPQDGDGVVIGVTKASFMSRGGRCVRQDGVVMSVAMAFVHGKKVRGELGFDGLVHGKEKVLLGQYVDGEPALF
jgi:hypothetical protein